MTKPDLTAERSHWQTLRSLAPYLWPEGEPGLRARVVISLLLLVVAKGCNVLVPLAFARAVDMLAPAAGAGALLVIPVALVIAYGIMRALSSVFAELRARGLGSAAGATEVLFAGFSAGGRGALFNCDAIGASLSRAVPARATRQIALQVFQHLHALSLRYHLDRQTGGLTRLIERGVRGITFVLDFMLFNIIPTLLEIVLVAIILWGMFDFSFAAVTLVTIAIYVTFTLMFPNWRLQFRRGQERA